MNLLGRYPSGLDLHHESGILDLVSPPTHLSPVIYHVCLTVNVSRYMAQSNQTIHGVRTSDPTHSTFSTSPPYPLHLTNFLTSSQLRLSPILFCFNTYLLGQVHI